MKWSPLLHGFAVITGVLGVLALIAAWIAAGYGTFMNLSEAHLFNDAEGLLLTSIAFGIGTLIHLKEEKR